MPTIRSAHRTSTSRIFAGWVALLAFGLISIPRTANAQNPNGLRPLVEALAKKRCAEQHGYHMIGDVHCKDLQSGSSDPDQTLRTIGTNTRQRIQTLTEQARRQDAACSQHVKGGTGGTSVGPTDAAGFAQSILRGVKDDATGMNPFPVSTMLSIPGVTQIQYEYKGLYNGPEVRLFKISGRVEGSVENAKLRLQMDGDVEGDKNLYVEYTVNYRKSRSPFPAWSPFLDRSADLSHTAVRQRLTTLSVTSQFSDKGEHRNGVQPWQEYEYSWQAQKVGESSDDIVKDSSAPSPQYAKYPYGGDWVGMAWGSETRFKQSRKAFVSQFSPALAQTMKPESSEGVMMSLNVKHESVFYFHVDFDGNVSGRGVITYTLDPNLCAVAVLARQVNEQINFMKYLPAVYLVARALGELAVSRFMGEWKEGPPTITAKVDEALKKLPRIEREAGEAEIAKFLADNPKVLPRSAHYAYADIDVENFGTKRLWGPANDNVYRGVRGGEIAPPTPVKKIINGAGKEEMLYAGRFNTRPGRPGWFEDGQWFEQGGEAGSPGNGPGWNRQNLNYKNRRGNDSELRIFDLACRLPKGAKGTIKLYTQNPPCSSCAGVIEQFSALFPDILIVVTSGG